MNMGYYSTSTWVEEMADITPQQFGYLLSKRKTDEERLALLDKVISDYFSVYRECANLPRDVERHNYLRLNSQFQSFSYKLLIVVTGTLRFGCILVDGIWKCYYTEGRLNRVPLSYCVKEFPRGVLHFCVSLDGVNDDKFIEFDNR